MRRYTSYSKFREKLLATQTVMSLIHLGARAFEELSGEVVQTVAFILSDKSYGYNARCLRLVEEVNAYEKEKAFLGEHKEFVLNEEELQKIPGVQFAYWALPVIFDTFANEKAAIEYADFKHGMSTSDNNRFLRLWFEVSMDAIKLDAHSKEDTITKKWYPYLKGGSFRRWYGNFYYVVNWQNDGKEIKDISNIKYPYLKGNLDFVLGGQKYFFTPGYTWSEMGSGSFGLRKFYHGCLFDVKGSSFFSHREDVGDYLMGLFNSNIFAYYKSILCPSLDYHSGDVARMPVIIRPDIKDIVVKIVRENVELSKSDWDSYETSWDFKKHPLVKGKTVKEAFNTWKMKCDDRVKQLVENEKKINELLIGEYGLKDYLKPDISVDDVSISGADRKRDIQSLLSYAVGCMFGRYSVDQEGILYAGGEWKIGQFKNFTPDEDNIIPVTDEEYLEDDIVSRLCKWLKDTYGEETLEENLDFIADSLSSKGDTSRSIIRNYFVNNFFKDHCNTFSITGSGKRPIYWLFDSGKQNGFKALIYLHRYNADTIGNLRIDYLHRMQRIYESEINRMQDMIDHSASPREAAQATKRREKLTKQLKECREYDEKLAHLALSRIELDLDDGVKVNYRKLQTASDGKFYEVLADSKNIMSKK